MGAILHRPCHSGKRRRPGDLSAPHPPLVLGPLHDLRTLPFLFAAQLKGLREAAPNGDAFKEAAAVHRTLRRHHPQKERTCIRVQPLAVFCHGCDHVDRNCAWDWRWNCWHPAGTKKPALGRLIRNQLI